jgi:virulence-associated protein VagC
MDLLDIQPETPLEITTDGGRIILTPVRSPAEKKKKVREAADWVNKKYSKALKKLAE